MNPPFDDDDDDVVMLSRMEGILEEQTALLREIHRLDGELHRDTASTPRRQPPLNKIPHYRHVRSTGYGYLQLLDAAVDDILVHGVSPRRAELPTHYTKQHSSPRSHSSPRVEKKTSAALKIRRK
eukprot:PhM_4_TR7041/c0_g1_i1/m.89698